MSFFFFCLAAKQFLEAVLSLNNLLHLGPLEARGFVWDLATLSSLFYWSAPCTFLIYLILIIFLTFDSLDPCKASLNLTFSVSLSPYVVRASKSIEVNNIFIIQRRNRCLPVCRLPELEFTYYFLILDNRKNGIWRAISTSKCFRQNRLD